MDNRKRVTMGKVALVGMLSLFFVISSTRSIRGERLSSPYTLQTNARMSSQSYAESADYASVEDTIEQKYQKRMPERKQNSRMLGLGKGFKEDMNSETSRANENDIPKKKMIIKNGNIQLYAFADISSLPYWEQCYRKDSISSARGFDFLVGEVKSILELTGNSDAYITSEYQTSFRTDVWCGENHDSIALREVRMTAMVPSQRFEKVMERLSDIEGIEVRNPSIKAEDVSSKYIDTVARTNVLEATQKALEKLMDRAEKVQDILNIERRLQEVIFQKEASMSKKKFYETGTSLSKLELTIKEQLPRQQSFGPNGIYWSPLGTVYEALDLLVKWFCKITDGLIYAVVLVLPPSLLLYAVLNLCHHLFPRIRSVRDICNSKATP